MDISSSINTAAVAATVKTPEAESETPTTRIYPAKPLSYSSNGVLKRLNHHHHRGGSCDHHYHHHHAVVVHYKECLKNHAAALGGQAVDGCGEFMGDPTANPTDPTSLKCAACGCHRNFHRREPPPPPLEDAIAVLEYQPPHRHHPPPPPPPPPVQVHHRDSSPNSSSPPPISSAYYPSALLALGRSGPQNDNNTPLSTTANHSSAFSASNPNGRKRFRTKFSQFQKDKMLEFAEKVGWKFQKRDEDLINELCGKIGVERGVLKVWMHNNKSTLGKKDQPITTTTTAAAAISAANSDENAHGIDFDLASTKTHNLEPNENNSRSFSAPLTNGSFYSS